MISTLHCHPDTPSPHVRAIRVEMDRLNDGGLAFRYSLTGDLEALRIPAQARAERADGLWRHTCFEAFIGGDGAAYREFNISPAGHWQAYDFTDYRRGRHNPALPAPNLWRRESAMGLVLGCRLIGRASCRERV